MRGRENISVKVSTSMTMMIAGIGMGTGRTALRGVQTRYESLPFSQGRSFGLTPAHLDLISQK